MVEIISKVDRSIIKNELNDNTFARRTNNGNKEIFIIDNHNAPNTVQEIGRLRELSFRDAGGGTGKPLDIDEYDIAETPFKQLIVWDPAEEEIVGGYRFLEGYEILKSGFDNPKTPTSHLFALSDEFKRDYFPYTFELGRSFVQPLYQPNYNLRKGLYSLDNLWDGLGMLVVQQPQMNYYFGKITMYPEFNARARDLIHYFLEHYFGDKDKLVYPITELKYKTDISDFSSILAGNDYLADFKILNQNVRQLGENIPALVNAYMNLSKTMKYFRTSVNDRFGDVEETGILINISDIHEAKKERHLNHIIEERI